MLYTILCYNNEEQIATWTKEDDDAVMGRLAVVHEGLSAKGKLGPVARLKPTKTAKTLRKNTQPWIVTDGPYAEAKEALLGFYTVDVSGDEEALEIARDLAKANPGGAYEVRPVMVFLPGDLSGSAEQPAMEHGSMR